MVICENAFIQPPILTSQSKGLGRPLVVRDGIFPLYSDSHHYMYIKHCMVPIFTDAWMILTKGQGTLKGIRKTETKKMD